MIDTHLHLVNEDYCISEVINNATLNGIKYFINGGATKKDNIDSIKELSKYSNIFLTIGYHPSEANSITDNDILLLEQQIINNKGKIVAIGEIGLDYHYEKDNKDKQVYLFERQLHLAIKYNLPVVIHTRNAINDTYEILSKYKLKGIIHCFSGSYEMAVKFIEIGFLLGIGGVVTFSNSKLFEVIKKIDINNVVLETDSPYLSPIRGNKNEPKNIKIIAQYLADLMEMSIEQVEKITTSNAIGLFDLDIDV